MHYLKDLWLAVALIIGATAVLLFSDIQQRHAGRRASAKSYPSIAIMQITSATLLDDHVQGVVDRLRERGFAAPGNQNIRQFNAQGDFGMANTIAREIVNGPYDMVITTSTVALQVFSKANASVRKPHVFGAVTDPFGAGVGITGPEPGQRPAYMTGIGTFQPVERAFVLARELNPSIKRIGVVWNPGEQCSEACMLIAYNICRQLGIELVEAIATNTSEVSEAVRSLTGRGIEAIWIGGDTVAASAISMIINIATQAGIPVFTNDHTDAAKGALFGLGANYHTVGAFTADMAADILDGADPASFRIENKVPELFKLNDEVLASMDGSWSVNAVIRELLDRQERQSAPFSAANDDTVIAPVRKLADRRGRPPLKIRIVSYSETEFAERTKEGILDGFKRAGMTEGRDYNLRMFNAQGDMSTLSSIMNTISADHVDLLMTVSTPALQAALRQAGSHTTIVFSSVADGVLAGAGRSETDHLPNVTGVTTRSPFRGMARLLKETIPGVRTVGTLFTPAEVNSVLYTDLLREALKKEGIDLLAIPVTISSDVPTSTTDLASKNIQAVCQIADNLTRPGFAFIARKAAERNIPVFVFDSDNMQHGATICLARDYYDTGLESADLAVRILNGEDPARLPFRNTQTEKFLINDELAQRYNLRISDSLRSRATIYAP